MKKSILDRIMWKETLVLLISLLFISYNSIAQCPCAAAQTTEAASGSTTTISSIRLDNTDNLCIKGTGGGTATVDGYVNMNGGELYFCTEDDTKITFGSSMDVTSEWNTGGGTIYSSAEIEITDDYEVYGFTWENTGNMVTQKITVQKNTSTNEAATLNNKSTGVIDATGFAINLTSNNSEINNEGVMTMASHSTSAGGVLKNQSTGQFTTTGNMDRALGETHNYGKVTVGSTLSLGGGGVNLYMTGGIFYAETLSMTSGIYNADIGNCAVFFVDNVVGVNCGSTYPNANISIIDVTVDTGDSPCNTEKNSGSHFTYTDYDNAPACAQILPVYFLDVYLLENQIHWVTAKEENNEYFVVERSFDGKTFEKVGNVKGAINSNYNIQYVFEDTDKIYKQAYYRIKQVDIDGKFTYSKIVTSINDNEPIITLYPNPTSQSDLNMSIENVEGNVSYQIISSIGDVLISNDVEVKDHFFEETIDVSNYTSGIYFVKVQTAQKIIVEQLIIE